LPNTCINNRLSILNRLKQPSIRLDVPCFIVTAKQDLLLNRTAQNSIKKVFNHHAEQQLDGPHFLLQTRARHCAKIITTLYAGLADVKSPVVPITIDPTIAL
jgi:surfactin synthase thioesterase subunit